MSRVTLAPPARGESLIVRVLEGQTLANTIRNLKFSGIRLLVNYDTPFETLMNEANCELCKGDKPQITAATFPEDNETGIKNAHFEIVRFMEYGVSTNEYVIEQFFDAGIRPANWKELLMFTARVGAFPRGYMSRHAFGSQALYQPKDRRRGLSRLFQRKPSPVAIHAYIEQMDDEPYLRPSEGTGAWKHENLFLGIHL